ncbi:MAG TPA: RNA polymerase sigma factor [Ktedonobacteraceae bacterium]
MPYAQSREYSIVQEQRVPDGVLVEQALAGDQYAFESLINRYHHQLVSHIRGFVKDHDQSYDVLQHVYLQLYLSLPTLLRNVSLKAWLFQVARNRCLDELRKKCRRAEIPFSALEREDGEEGQSLLEAIPDREPLSEEITERSELHGSLHAAIVSLPPKYRSIVHLRCFKQLTFAEIGQRLNMPETTAKTYFYRSLPRLRSALA